MYIVPNMRRFTHKRRGAVKNKMTEFGGGGGGIGVGANQERE
jgi:hypothetical protein